MNIYDMPEREDYGYSATLRKEFSYDYACNSKKIPILISISIGYEHGRVDRDSMPLAMISMKSEIGLDFSVVIKNTVLFEEIINILKNFDDKSKKTIFDIATSFLKGEFIIAMLEKSHKEGVEKGKRDLIRQFHVLFEE